jgi:hypothetical protein
MRFLKSYKLFESKQELEEVILSCFENQIDDYRIAVIKNDDSKDIFFINLDIDEFINRVPENEKHTQFLMKLVPTEDGFDMFVYKRTTGDLSRIYPEEWEHLLESLDYLGYKISKIDDFPRMVNYMKVNNLVFNVEDRNELNHKFMRFMKYKIEEI